MQFNRQHPLALPRAPKPTCSYHCMIGMALLASSNEKLPVNEIYKYILTQFPYFRTAADNWKNSVRHCLSLGQCFHKVVRPGVFTHKKGFHWQVATDKLDAVSQEVLKYIATTGVPAENFGIHSSKLQSPSQGTLLSSPIQTKHPQQLTPTAVNVGPNGSIFQTPSTAISPMTGVSLCTASPSLKLVGLQLSQTDLEVLRQLGQLPTPSLSPYDYSLLTNPNICAELTSIVDGSSQIVYSNGQSMSTLTHSNVSNDTPKQLSPPLMLSPPITPPHQFVFPVHESTPKAISTTFSNAASIPFVDTSLSKQVSCANDKKISTGLPLLNASKVTDSNSVDYSETSPTEFTALTKDVIGCIEEDVVAEELDSSYPFLYSDSEQDRDISLNQLQATSDWEDTEEPILKQAKNGSKCFAFEPVEDDWNSWKEPEYVEKMSELVNSFTASPELPTHSKFNDQPHYGSSSKDDDRFKHGKRRPKRPHCSKLPVHRVHGHTRKWWANTKEKRKISRRRQKRPISDSKNISKKKADEQRDLPKTSTPLVISIPFVKLMTSRQMKKYCRR